MSFNRVILCGNVGKDPETLKFNSGDEIAKFSLATSESWRDKSTGDRKEKTEWHNVVVRNDALVKVVRQYVTKGTKLLIEGKIETRKWEKDGSTHYATEIVLGLFDAKLVLLGSRQEGDRPAEDRGSGDSGRARDGRSSPQQEQKRFADDLDDDIPF